MAIAVHCGCGSVLKIDAKHAGKKVRCPKCKQVNVVPQATEGEPQMDDPAPPPAPRPPAAGGVPSYLLAQRSGLNPDEKQPPERMVIPVKPIIWFFVLLAIASGVWFIWQAMITQSATETGREFFEYARFGDAIDFLEIAQARTEGPEQAQVVRMIRQVKLEAELNVEEVLDAGKPIPSDEIVLKPQMVKTIKLTRVVPIELTNNSDGPITLHRDFFYIRGGFDLVLGAQDSKMNDFDGVVLEAGETYTGQVAFRRVPVPARGSILTPMSLFQWSLIFNDGEHYVKAGVPEK